MALINPPAWMQAGSYPARTDRLVVASMLSYPGFLVDEATPLRIRQGVRPSYTNQQLKVRAAPTPNMTVIVSAGMAYVDNHDSGGSGTYVCINDADVILTIAPAGGAGQFRKDCVIASVYDAETAGSVSEWRLEVIQGTYAASAGAAVRPSLPPNAQILADVAVGASVTSIAAGNIGDVRQYTVSAGGIVPLTSTVDMNRPAPGQVRYLTDTDRFLYGKTDGSSGELQKSLNTAWTAWTPAWTTSTGTHLPSYGDAAIDCKYVKQGRTVMFYMNIVFGSGTNFGASANSGDNWKFALPVPAASTGVPIGKVSYEPGSTVRATSGMATTTGNDATTMTLYVDSSQVNGSAPLNGGIADSVTPFTWLAAMRLCIVGQYESAS